MDFELKTRSLFRHQLMNIVQSGLLLAGIATILGGMGWMIAGVEGLLWSLIFGMATVLLMPYLSPQLVMRVHQARLLGEREASGLYRIMAFLASKAALAKVPRLYYIPSPMMNAFTVGGKEDSAIAITDGLLRQLNEREMVGVLAHEVAHIQNHDTWILSLAQHAGRLTRVMSYFGLFLLLFNLPLLLRSDYGMPWLFIAFLITVPWLSTLLQFALSRTREFHADLGAVRFTKDPLSLASALEKINRNVRAWQRWLLQGYLSGPSMLQTHPPTKARIQRLLSLGESKPLLPYYGANPSRF